MCKFEWLKRNNRIAMFKTCIAILVLTSFLNCSDLNPKTLFVEQISCYYNYSSVNWEQLKDKFYRPYNADWDKNLDSLIKQNDFPTGTASEYWHLLQNAKTDFHQKSLPFRASASPQAAKAIDHTESMFDSVFVKCIETGYYMRVFPETYNKTMSAAIDSLVIFLSKSNK